MFDINTNQYSVRHVETFSKHFLYMFFKCDGICSAEFRHGVLRTHAHFQSQTIDRAEFFFFFLFSDMASGCSTDETSSTQLRRLGFRGASMRKFDKSPVPPPADATARSMGLVTSHAQTRAASLFQSVLQGVSVLKETKELMEPLRARQRVIPKARTNTDSGSCCLLQGSVGNAARRGDAPRVTRGPAGTGEHVRCVYALVCVGVRCERMTFTSTVVWVRVGVGVVLGPVTWCTLGVSFSFFCQKFGSDCASALLPMIYRVKLGRCISFAF